MAAALLPLDEPPEPDEPLEPLEPDEPPDDEEPDEPPLDPEPLDAFDPLDESDDPLVPAPAATFFSLVLSPPDGLSPGPLGEAVLVAAARESVR